MNLNFTEVYYQTFDPTDAQRELISAINCGMKNIKIIKQLNPFKEYDHEFIYVLVED